MRLGAYFPNGVVRANCKERKFNYKRAIGMVFCQLFLILTVIAAGIYPSSAHHMGGYGDYFQRYPLPSPPNIRFPFKASPKQNFTRSEVVGAQMTECYPATKIPGDLRSWRPLHNRQRTVRITVSDKLKLTESSVNGLGYAGLHFALSNCPAKPVLSRPQYGYIEIQVWRNNRMIYRFDRSKNTPLHDGVYINRLWSVWDKEIQRKRQQEQAAARNAAKKQREAESSAFWSKFWFFAFLIGGGWIWFKYRGPIMAFYYENFTKHPAESIVNKSVRTDVKLDGQSLARELDKAAQASNPIEAKVRAKQAREIAKKATEQADVYKAQEELADAMMDVERAKRAEKRAREAVKRAGKKKD